MAVLAKGPVGYWRLGEMTGPTAADASGQGNDGTYLGNVNFDQPGALHGGPNTAVGLNGPVSLGYNEILSPADGAFSQPTSGLGLTVEVWMRPDALTFAGETDQVYIHWL
ncbi:MAG: hypothetical protein JO057_07365, partial [Chloroflexi bacterium]|nr:hypothetical protein [Chloroflexota bacterium]